MSNGSMPSIAVDRLGYVHVGWTLNMGGSSWYAYHVENQSGVYVETLVDSKSASAQPIFPFLGTDSLGFFHLLWRDLSSSTQKPVLYRTNNPITRALVKKSFSSSGHTHDPILDITSDDIAHVITEADSCTGCASGSNLYDESFVTNTSYAGRVTSLVQDSNDSTGLQQFSSVVTPDDTRHLVFSMRLAPPADNQRLIYYSQRPAGSMSWTTPVSITGHEDNYQGWPAIVADPTGTLHVVYSSGDYGIYYVNNSGGTWSAPLRINDQNTVVDAIPSVAIDPNGALHVVFQRWTPNPPGSSIVSLHYTTNAYDRDNWLDPASEILADVGSTGYELTHQNRKIAINWVDGQVLVPYLSGSAIWLASTTDVPITPADAGGTSTLTVASGFVPPVQLVRTTSTTAATASDALKLTIADAGSDGKPTRIAQLHVQAGENQSLLRVLGRDEGLSYLLGGARLITDSGAVITGTVSDRKIVFVAGGEELWVPDGETRTYYLQLWLKNQAYVTGTTIDLRIKPDQDVVVDPAGSAMLADQPVVVTGAMTAVDALTSCPNGAACSDANACTRDDTCNMVGACIGTPLSCSAAGCNTSQCNGTPVCTLTPVSAGTSCDDGDACTHEDTCDAGGTCAGTSVTCNDDACNTRTCNGSATCTIVAKAAGTSCDDGDA
ncbi:MAG TPA: hypothetical protein VJR89_23185, partial [Polyangiales bacterium]|nr:hypothetical protein [Polyangiales bacterium]